MNELGRPISDSVSTKSVSPELSLSLAKALAGHGIRPTSKEQQIPQPGPLPINLLNFMEGKSGILGDICIIPRQKSDIKFRPGLKPDAPYIADHELVQYKTIRKPRKQKHKHRQSQSVHTSVVLPALSTSSVVKPQSMPVWIRHQHLQEFYKIREHQNAIAELARKQMFQSVFSDENEIVEPWKSPIRNPPRVRKPKSMYILDGKDSKLQPASMKDDKAAQILGPPIVSNYPSMEGRTKEISYRDKLAIENYHVLHPTHSSSQSVYSSFLSLPDGHVFTDTGKPPATKVDTSAKRTRVLLGSMSLNALVADDPKALNADVQDDTHSKESNFTDSSNPRPKEKLSLHPPAVANQGSTPVKHSARPAAAASLSVATTSVKQPLIRITVTSPMTSGVSSPVSQHSPQHKHHHHHHEHHLHHHTQSYQYSPQTSDSPVAGNNAYHAANTSPRSPQSGSLEKSHNHQHLSRTPVRQKPMNVHLYRTPSRSSSPIRPFSGTPMNSHLTQTHAEDHSLKYLYGSPSAAVNLHSPVGYESTDDLIGARMHAAQHRPIPYPENHQTGLQVASAKGQKATHDDDSSQESESCMNDEDAELHSLSSDSKVDHQPMQPPLLQGLGPLDFPDHSDKIAVSGLHYDLAPPPEELTMAQKAKARDVQIQELADNLHAQTEKVRLQRLVDEFGIEEANKIECARRWRQTKKQKIKSQPPIYALSGAGCALVSRHQNRTDAVPLVGIVKDCVWDKSWPSVPAPKAREITVYKGMAVVTVQPPIV